MLLSNYYLITVIEVRRMADIIDIRTNEPMVAFKGQPDPYALYAELGEVINKHSQKLTLIEAVGAIECIKHKLLAALDD